MQRARKPVYVVSRVQLRPYHHAQRFYVPDSELGISLNPFKAVKNLVKSIGKTIDSALSHTIDIAKAGVKAAGSVALAPTKSVINLATGKSILKPFEQAGKHVGDAAQEVATTPALKPVLEVGLPAAGFVLGGPIGAGAGTFLFQSAKAGRDALKEDQALRSLKNAAIVGASVAGAQFAARAVGDAIAASSATVTSTSAATGAVTTTTGAAAAGGGGAAILAAAGKTVGAAATVAKTAQQAVGAYQAIEAAKKAGELTVAPAPVIQPMQASAENLPAWLLPAGIGLLTLLAVKSI